MRLGGALALRLVIDASELAAEERKKEEKEKEEEKEEEDEEAGEEGEEEEEKTIVDELASFLSERLGKEIAISGDELSLDVEGPAERRRVKQLLKKFLYKRRLDDDFRVIALEEGGALKIKSRRFPRLRPRWA